MHQLVGEFRFFCLRKLGIPPEISRSKETQGDFSDQTWGWAKKNGEYMNEETMFEQPKCRGVFTPLRVGWPPTPQVYFGP